MLFRGNPSERRRFMDLTLSLLIVITTPPCDFHRGIVERNRS